MVKDLFLPDPVRAAATDRNARSALARSLATVFDACAATLTWDADDQAALLAALQAHCVAPAVFALYAELVEAVLGQDHATAQARMDALLRPELRDWTAPRMVTLDPASLGAGLAELYARAIQDDPGLALDITAVSADERERVAALHDATAELLLAAAPDLLREIEVVAHEIVLVQDAGDDPGISFDGASTFYLWGAVVLNSPRLRSRPQLAVALAHEAGHAYLLGSTLGAALVDNDPADRFHSPLRADPRPMDGVVHASFVLARMMWCQDRLLACRRLDADEAAWVTHAREINRRQFADSADLIQAKAQWTAQGRALWQAARDWVEGAHSPAPASGVPQRHSSSSGMSKVS